MWGQVTRFTFLLVIASVMSLILVKNEASSDQNGSTPLKSIELTIHARQTAANGNLEEALKITKQALGYANTELGPSSENTAYILDDAATLSFKLRKFEEAASFSSKAATCIQRSPKANSAEAFNVVANNAAILATLGKWKEANTTYSTLLGKNARFSDVSGQARAQALLGFATSYQEMAEYKLAETAYLETIKISEKEKLGYFLVSANLGMAGLKVLQDDIVAAEKAIESISDEQKKARGISPQVELLQARVALSKSDFQSAESKLKKLLNSPDAKSNPLLRANTSYVLLVSYVLRGQYLEAESLSRQLIADYSALVGPQHAAVARIAHALGIIYYKLGEPEKSSSSFKTAIEIGERNFGKNSPNTALTHSEFGYSLAQLGEPKAALIETSMAMNIMSQTEKEFALQRAYITSGNAFALSANQRYQEALEGFSVALSSFEALRGTNSIDLAPGLTEVGKIYLLMGKPTEAKPYLERAEQILRVAGAISSSQYAQTLMTLAKANLMLHLPNEAEANANEVYSILQTRAVVGAGSVSAHTYDEIRGLRPLFEAYMEVMFSLKGEEGISRLFSAAQLAESSETAQVIAKMAAKLTAANTKLAEKLQNRQLALSTWQSVDQKISNSVFTSTVSAGASSLTKLFEAQKAAEKSLRQLDEEISAEFPEYFSLISPLPVAVNQLTASLQENEALVSYFLGEKASYIFLLRNNRPPVVKKLELQVKDIFDDVKAIRETLDPQMMADSQGNLDIEKLKPFNADKAYHLYLKTMKPIESELDGVGNIYVVAEGPLQSIPLNILLTSSAQKALVGLDDYAKLPWLMKKYSVSMLPSVSSLKLLSQLPNIKQDSPFLGIGDPAFSGKRGDTRGAKISSLYDRGGIAKVDALRASFSELPETRQELSQIAKSLGAGDESLWLREQATESHIKKSALNKYSTIAFATHGLLADETAFFRNYAEPALVLTPPKVGSTEDDGLLVASEIASLNLNSDLVVLSACNTAAGDGTPRAEGFSGLAKAFFHAGARSLLVSHWAVPSQSTAKLTAGYFEALERQKVRNKASALDDSMNKILESDEIYFHHPMFWAPFVLVGKVH